MTQSVTRNAENYKNVSNVGVSILAGPVTFGRS
jgi:hypothetical protein